jgi:hypothetical protein
MTMFWKSSAAALVALGLWATSAPAQDHGAKVFRLGDLPNQDQAAKTYRLGDLPAQLADEEDDTLLVRGHGGGGHGGGHAHGGGHGHVGVRYYGGGRYYGGRYYGGYRGYYGSYGYGYGYYRPRYIYSSGYYSPYYYCPPQVYYYQPVYTYYPVASTQSYSGIVGTYQPATPSRALAPMSRADQEQLPPVVPPRGRHLPVQRRP